MRSVFTKNSRNLNPTRRIMLPWGLDIDIRLDDAIGKSIWYLGIYDLVVSEVIWRLTDPDDFAADIGANIGHMSSVFAKRLGNGGKLIGFEPHPELFERLCVTTSRWCSDPRLCEIQVVNQAVSDILGVRVLTIPDNFDSNRGIAYIVDTTMSVNNENVIQMQNQINVNSTTLDEFFSNQPCPNILKVDVEGHETAVFRGALGLMSERKIRDIIFEEHGNYPTPSMQILEQSGYALFRVKKSFWGPELVDPKSAKEPRMWEAVSYLATRDLERAHGRLTKKGWRILGT